MKYPTPTYGAHRRFCEADRWDFDKKRDWHDIYKLRTADHPELFTMISHGWDKTDYKTMRVWSTILRGQLKVTPAEFWACVSDGQRPERTPDGRSKGLAEQQDGSQT